MNPERWEEINRLYNAALEVEEEERSIILGESLQSRCGAPSRSGFATGL